MVGGGSTKKFKMVGGPLLAEKVAPPHTHTVITGIALKITDIHEQNFCQFTD